VNAPPTWMADATRARHSAADHRLPGGSCAWLASPVPLNPCKQESRDPGLSNPPPEGSDDVPDRCQGHIRWPCRKRTRLPSSRTAAPLPGHAKAEGCDRPTRPHTTTRRQQRSNEPSSRGFSAPAKRTRKRRPAFVGWAPLSRHASVTASQGPNDTTEYDSTDELHLLERRTPPEGRDQHGPLQTEKR
jgi:hypothetical protein